MCNTSYCRKSRTNFVISCQLQSIPCWRVREAMSLFQLSPGRHIPPYGHGKRQQSYRDGKFLWHLCKALTSCHVVDFTTGAVVWESGPACVCPFPPSVCVLVLGLGNVTGESVSHQQQRAGKWSWCVSGVLSLHGSPVAPRRAWHTHTEKFQLLHLGILHLSSNYCLLRIHR